MSKNAGWRAEPGTEHYELMRQEIIIAAEKLVNEVGIAPMRIGDLAARLGCTRQNLYRYFASKEDVINAVLLHRTQRLGRRLGRSAGKDMTPQDRLINGFIDGVELASRDHSIRSYYSGASAQKMIGFVANSKGLLDTVVQSLGPVLDEAEGWIRDDLTREDIAEWLSRIFINELIWSMTVKRTRSEREAFLRKMLLPSLRRP